MSDPTLIAALPDKLQTLAKCSTGNIRVLDPCILTSLEQRQLYEAVQELQRNYSLMVQALKAGS